MPKHGSGDVLAIAGCTTYLVVMLSFSGKAAGHTCHAKNASAASNVQVVIHQKRMPLLSFAGAPLAAPKAGISLHKGAVAKELVCISATSAHSTLDLT